MFSEVELIKICVSADWQFATLARIFAVPLYSSVLTNRIKMYIKR